MMINNLDKYLDKFLDIGFTLYTTYILHETRNYRRSVYLYSMYNLSVMTNGRGELTECTLSKYNTVDDAIRMEDSTFILSIHRVNNREYNEYSMNAKFNEIFKNEIRNSNINKIIYDESDLNNLLDNFLDIGFTISSRQGNGTRITNVFYTYSNYELNVVFDISNDVSECILLEHKKTNDEVNIVPIFLINRLKWSNSSFREGIYNTFNEIFKSEIRDSNINKVIHNGR